jgi:UDP:flavonoid glycosyltransferase YjiC (YdhE family)
MVRVKGMGLGSGLMLADLSAEALFDLMVTVLTQPEYKAAGARISKVLKADHVKPHRHPVVQAADWVE